MQKLTTYNRLILKEGVRPKILINIIIMREVHFIAVENMVIHLYCNIYPYLYNIGNTHLHSLNTYSISLSNQIL